MPSETGDEDAPGQDTEQERRSTEGEKQAPQMGSTTSLNSKRSHRTSQSIRTEDMKRAPSRGDAPFERWERDEMEKLLGELRGHLVLYPTRFLEGEDVSNNFLFNADR